MSLAGVSAEFRRLFNGERERVNDMLAQLAEENPDWTPPVVKLRSVEQYIRGDHLPIALSRAGWRTF